MVRFILIFSLCTIALGAVRTLENSSSENVIDPTYSISIEAIDGVALRSDQKAVILIDIRTDHLLKLSLQNAYSQKNVKLFKVNLQEDKWMSTDDKTIVESIGDYVANQIIDMCRNNTIKINKLEVIAHGTGCTIAGLAGRKLKQLKLGGNEFLKIPTIIALDPSGLGQTENVMLQQDDAEKVVVFHTNSGYIGDWRKLGHLDIYLNGGVYQPSCPSVGHSNECSHEFAYKYYTELLTNSSVSMIAYDYYEIENVKKWTSSIHTCMPQYEGLSSLDQLLSKNGTYIIKTTPEPYRLEDIFEIVIWNPSDYICGKFFNPRKHLDIELFSPNHRDKPLQIKFDQFEDLGGDYFNKSWPTKVVIHGWKSGDYIPTDIGLSYAKDLYGIDVTPRNYFNVISINWKKAAEEFYVWAHSCVEPVGKTAADFIYYAKKTGKLDPSTLEVIGHSLGAHAAGWVGRKFKELSGLSLPKIIGLDPAGPLITKHLTMVRTDAKEVYVIHTNSRPSRIPGFPQLAKGYGKWGLLGTVDIFLNGGMKQEKMTNIMSHNWAPVYHRDIMNAKKQLTGYKFLFADADRGWWQSEADRLEVMKKNVGVEHFRVKVFGDAEHPVLKKGEAIYLDTFSNENTPWKPKTAASAYDNNFIIQSK